MATIRIHLVAKALGLPSQEIIEQLRRDSGIDVKSASSTVEEIVARQFAMRVARERGIELPSGRLFTEAALRRPSARRGRPTQPGAEAPKPARPTLGPPRLIKAAKAARAEARAAAEAEAAVAADAESAAAPNGEAPPNGVAAAAPAAPPAQAIDTPVAPAAAAAAASDVKPSAPPRRAAVLAKPTGRAAPPTLRLRVEEPKRPAASAAAVAPPAATAAATDVRPPATMRTDRKSVV